MRPGSHILSSILPSTQATKWIGRVGYDTKVTVGCGVTVPRDIDIRIVELLRWDVITERGAGEMREAPSNSIAISKQHMLIAAMAEISLG